MGNPLCSCAEGRMEAVDPHCDLECVLANNLVGGDW